MWQEPESFLVQGCWPKSSLVPHWACSTHKKFNFWIDGPVLTGSIDLLAQVKVDVDRGEVGLYMFDIYKSS